MTHLFKQRLREKNKIEIRKFSKKKYKNEKMCF